MGLAASSSGSHELRNPDLGMANRKEAERSPLFPLAFVIFWYAGLLLFPMTFNGMQAYQDFVLNAYLWLLLGICFACPRSPFRAVRASQSLSQQSPLWMR